MSTSSISISELFIAKEDGRSTVRLLSSSPTPLEEKNLGRLFAVMEIDSQDTINDNILDVISNEIHAQYYRAESFEVEAAFEHALQKTNQKLQELISEIGEEWLEHLNIVIGVQKGPSIVFTNIGSVISFMIHDGKTVDIIDSAKTKAQDINPLKIFTNIVAGELSEKSAMIFATETILDYLSKEKIRRLLEEKQPDEAVEEFYHLLEEDTTNTNFTAVILKPESFTAPAPGQPKDIPVINQPAAVDTSVRNDSMTDLMGKQNDTSEMLSTSLWPNVKKSIGRYVQQITGKKSEEVAEQQEVGTTVQEIPEPTRRPAGSPSKNIMHTGFHVVKKAAAAGSGGTQKLVRNIKTSRTKKLARKTGSYTRRSQRTGSVRGAASSGIAGVVKRFQVLSLTQKAFFIIAIIILLIFAQLVVKRGEDNITKEQEQQYAETMSDIDLKINEGKAAALYDGEKARTLFIEARTMLESVPSESDAYADRGEELQSILSAQLQQVNNIVTLENPSPVLDYSSINPAIDISHIILLGASMYGFDKNNQSVYRGNLENQGTTVTISDSSADKTIRQAVKASPGTGAALFSDQSFALFNPIAESMTPLNLHYDGNHNFADLFVFGVRLYTLDTANNQIYRHRKSGNDFGQAEEWVSGDVELDAAVSLAIDGDIYVLKNNGEVLKMASGAVDNNFSLSAIDPALSSASTLYTDEDTANLYVLDPMQQRVVVFGKDGSFHAQYTSTSFTQLTDMVVDEANGKVYVLNNAKVYEIELQ